jgi:hypothetical protein
MQYFYQKEWKNFRIMKMNMSYGSTSSISHQDFLETFKFKFSQASFAKFYAKRFGAEGRKVSPILDAEVEVFAPSVFQQIIDLKKNVDIKGSLDVDQNGKFQDWAIDAHREGQIGELFFPSFDNKLLIKTLS